MLIVDCVIATLVLLVLIRKFWYGLAFWAGAMLVAWARMASHVHDLQDVIAGLSIGAIGAVAGVLIATWLVRRLKSRLSVAPA